MCELEEPPPPEIIWKKPGKLRPGDARPLVNVTHSKVGGSGRTRTYIHSFVPPSYVAPDTNIPTFCKTVCLFGGQYFSEVNKLRISKTGKNTGPKFLCPGRQQPC